MNLTRKNPCSECPFRKKSLRGWLGPWKSAAEIIDQSHSEVGLPCHMDYDPRLRKGVDPVVAMEQSHACVGSLQHSNASGKRYRNPILAQFAELVGKSADVLGLREFYEHHMKKKDNP